jgi:hypothetical protein
MQIVLCLLAALGYGSADFCAGVGARRGGVGPLLAIVQVVAVITAPVAVLLFPGAGPSGKALGWGALAGLGSALGTLGLYSGSSGLPWASSCPYAP